MKAPSTIFAAMLVVGSITAITMAERAAHKERSSARSEATSVESSLPGPEAPAVPVQATEPADPSRTTLAGAQTPETASATERLASSRELRGQAASCIVSVDGGRHDGGGVAVGANLVLTSKHLLDRCTDCPVRVGAGSPWRWREAVRVPLEGDDHGLALLRVDGATFAPADAAPHRNRRGETVFAYPPSPGDTWIARSTGAVRVPSSDARNEDSQRWEGLLFTDLPCPEGALGSAVFSQRDGRLIGIVFGTVDEPGSWMHGLTAAIGAPAIRDVLGRIPPPTAGDE